MGFTTTGVEDRRYLILGACCGPSDQFVVLQYFRKALFHRVLQNCCKEIKQCSIRWETNEDRNCGNKHFYAWYSCYRAIGNLNGVPRRRKEGKAFKGMDRGQGRGRSGGRRDEKFSADDLDADLEKYHVEAIQLN
ncbi:hypothetical protein V8G54_025248 [Vigna mungo]|uniref:Chromatin target of PRMT1 protein C-terminal domain-containing protein n=1 Tax=Vigna mungo TaxID=3915 RepID=A0AAQ3RS29_VIGMU